VHLRGMAEIELAPVSERLDEEELKQLARLLEKSGLEFDLAADKGMHPVANRLSEDAMNEFLDRLDAHEVAAEIYLPVEFDGTLSIGDYRVGSSQTLSAALEEVKDELEVDDDYEDEEDGEDDGAGEDMLIMAQLKQIFRLLVEAVEESIENNAPLHINV